jgi:hypothetical protein
VRDFPVRVCATLAWHTLHAALAGQPEPVSTGSGEAAQMSIFDWLHRMTKPKRRRSTKTCNERWRAGERVIGALRTVYDPEIPVNIYDLFCLRADVSDGPNIRMTLTAPGCPRRPSRNGGTNGRSVPGVTDGRSNWFRSAMVARDDVRGSPARAGNALHGSVGRRRAGSRMGAGPGVPSTWTALRSRSST